jgi:hypothetical protein
MKTAMQELIDNLESIDINIPNGVKLIFLEKEKEQMKNMYLKGIENYDPTFKRKSQWTPVTKKKSL